MKHTMYMSTVLIQCENHFVTVLDLNMSFIVEQTY